MNLFFIVSPIPTGLYTKTEPTNHKFENIEFKHITLQFFFKHIYKTTYKGRIAYNRYYIY